MFLATAPMSPIVGGLSNFSWHARAAGRECFVRLAHPGGAALGADHANECAVLQLAAAAGIAPPVVHCDPDRGVLVTQWIATDHERDPAANAARPLARVGRPVDERAVGTLAQTLARLHALEVPDSLRRVDFAVQAQALATSLDAARADREAAAGSRSADASARRRQKATSARRQHAAAGLRSTASELFAQYAVAPRALALCHHDLNALNLLQDPSGRLWIVDWEYAGLGDPALDLASYACQHQLRLAQRRHLASAYREAGGAVDDTRLELACWLFDYVQWLWYRAALVVDAAPAAVSLADTRARRLARSLRERASGLLRCNNEVFSGQD